VEADCLSRNPVLEPHECEDEQLKVVNIIELDDILKDQQENEYVRREKDKLIQKNNVYYKKKK